jgi:acetyl-CoA C-acetyltransferase
MQDIWILGAYQLASARVAPDAVEVVHVGNAFGELFAAQGHLGAMPATVEPALWGVPATRHEAACASGSVATLAAIADLRSRAYDVALVAGVELEKTVPGPVGAAHLAAAAWAGHEGGDTKNVWAQAFSEVADEYDRRYGLDEAHLRAIAELNYGNARRNPNA